MIDKKLGKSPNDMPIIINLIFWCFLKEVTLNIKGIRAIQGRITKKLLNKKAIDKEIPKKRKYFYWAI